MRSVLASIWTVNARRHPRSAKSNLAAPTRIALPAKRRIYYSLVLRCVAIWLAHSPARVHKPPARAYPGPEARTGRQGRYAGPGPNPVGFRGWAAPFPRDPWGAGSLRGKPMPGRCATGAGRTGIINRVVMTPPFCELSSNTQEVHT
jgi:hypothetical protein